MHVCARLFCVLLRNLRVCDCGIDKGVMQSGRME